MLIEAYGFGVENLQILLQFRLKDDIIMVSSNPQRIVVAKSQGFSVVPIIPYERFYRDDYQLNLLENYLLSIRYRKDMAQKIKNGFEFLLQQVHRGSQRSLELDEEEEEKVHSPKFRQSKKASMRI